MGLSINRDRFDEVDYERFGERLERCLLALRMMLDRDGFARAYNAAQIATAPVLAVSGNSLPLRPRQRSPRPAVQASPPFRRRRLRPSRG
jgi:hypothetical protein